MNFFSRIFPVGILSLSLLLLGNIALADTNIPSESKSIDHAPIGVMAEHTHKKGEWMFSFRFAQMYMDDNYDNTNKVSSGEIFNKYMVAPESMRTDMYMFGAMYGATDYLTIMAMTSYVQKFMTLQHKTMGTFSTYSKGLSDTKLIGMLRLIDLGSENGSLMSHHKLHANIGVSLPTGSINQRGNTPMASDVTLGYPMQLGSGTFDPIVGLNYVYKIEQWLFGSQANMVIRFGENYKGYRLGNEYSLTGWVSRSLNQYVGVSFRVLGKAWGNIHGKNTDLNPMMSPVNNPNARGGERIDTMVGVNFINPDGFLKNNRLAAEFGIPVYQRLDGPQLGLNYMFTLGWQWSF